MMRIRRIIEDYEAKLRPPGGAGGASGKAEWEAFAGGDEEFDVRVRGVQVADGEALVVLVDDEVVGRIVIRSGRGRLEIRSRDGATVPRATTNQTLRVVRGGATVLEGVFVPD